MKNARTIEYPICIVRGDTFSFKFNINELTEEEITEAYLTCKLKSDPNGEIIFQKRLNEGITPITNSLYKINIERVDTMNMDVNLEYMYDIEIKYGNAISTIINGPFIVKQDYTNPDDEV